MKLKKIWQDILRFLGHYLSVYLIDVLCKSLKIEQVNVEAINNLKAQKKNYVLAFWHGTMLIPWYLHKGDGFAALTSRSKDGDLLAKILKSWDYRVIRGSSSSGGNKALEMMVDLSKSEYSIAVTPDGPRGPALQMKAGAIITAKRSGIPLILLGIGIEKKKELKSWDKFQIPKFFTKVKVIYSEPIYIDRNLGYSETSNLIKMCESKLNELQLNAGKF